MRASHAFVVAVVLRSIESSFWSIAFSQWRCAEPAAAPFIHRPAITQAALDELDAVAGPLTTAPGRLQYWIMDLSVEVYNQLLGEYADQSGKRRGAPDQTYFTVTVDPADRASLGARFREMPFMREALAAEEHARQASQHA
ncbi:hypothetical protein [Paraburkholderia sp. HD33-4]|uniref:hypothetical protein n=1 Tax=Paraburkholderia sp. HD33-4 TaxID=2883242 RepID=UPI001F2427AD|nr:hypothetical protein [Paraburkholderia sp. HD33-4]